MSPEAKEQEEGMRKYNWKNTGLLLAAGLLLIGLLVPGLCVAGSLPVPTVIDSSVVVNLEPRIVTVFDSSAAGTVNFEPPPGTTGGVDAGEIAAGGSPSVEISPGVVVTVTSIDSAVNNGSLGRDQVSSGYGDGGTVVTLSAESVANVLETAETESVEVDGQSMTLFEALPVLSTSAELGGVRVAMPSGHETDLSASLTNVADALTSRNPTSIGTALNDASIALTQALKNGESAPNLKIAAVAIADLLSAARRG